MTNDILKPTKSGNPRAAQTRVKGKSAGSSGGQRAHDLRIGPQPDYVDPSRTHLNRVLIAPQTGTQLRKICEERRALRDTVRGMKSSAAVGMVGIITFGHEAQKIFEDLTPAQQDAAYRETAESIATRLNSTLTGLVVHCDESAPHAHFQLPAYDLTGHPISETAKRGALRDLQTITAEVMGRHAPGIERGYSKQDRLKAGATPAEVVNRSVAQLHDELPFEIAAKEAQLAELDAKIKKNEGLAAKALEKAKVNEAKADKAVKNAALYEQRAERLREQVADLEVRLRTIVQEQEAFIADGKRIADTHRERASAAMSALSAAEAQKKGVEEEAVKIREKAQEVADALLRQAHDQGVKEARRITKIVSKRLEEQLLTDGQKALLHAERERDQWRNAFELLRDAVKALVPDDLYQKVRNLFIGNWSKHSDNADGKSGPPPYSSGPSSRLS